MQLVIVLMHLGLKQKIKKHNFDTFTSKHYKLLFFGFGTSSRRFLVRPYPNLAISSEKNRN